MGAKRNASRPFLQFGPVSRFVKSGLACIAACLAAAALNPFTPAEAQILGPTCAVPGDWDVSAARGKTRLIRFETDEGTDMSVDVSPDSTWFVFDLVGHVYRLPVTGGRAQSLTQDSGIALNYHPRISPDGRTIAFVSDRAGNDNLWLMDGDGSNPRPLLLDSRSRMVEPVWLPDGTGVLFTRLHVTSYGIYRSEDRLWKVTLDGQAEPLLEKDQPAGTGRFAGSERLSWPSVTPDGRQVYFGRADFDGSNREVHRLDLANGNRDRVTPGDLSETCCASSAVPDITGVAAPEVSPDGRFLAFVRKLPGVSVQYGDIELDSATGLWIRDLQTGQERLLMAPITPDLMNQHPPWQVRVLPGYDWAADGESIFLSEGGKIRRVWLETGAVETIEFVAEVRRSISEQARRVGKLDTQPRAPRLIRWPTLSEDGQWLAYAAAGDVWLESVSGPAVLKAPLADTANTALSPAFSPDSAQLAFVELDGARSAVSVFEIAGTSVRVLRNDAIYFGLRWDSAGEFVYAFRYPPGLDWRPESGLWSLVRISAADGAIETLLTNQFANPLSVTTDGRIGFHRPWSPTSRDRYNTSRGTLVPDGREYVTVSADGGDLRIEAVVPGVVQGAALSPDGRQLAVEQRQDIYLADLAQADGAATVDILTGGGVVAARLSNDGGYYASWSAGALVFASAAEIRSLRPGAGGVTSSRTVKARIEPPRPGTLALSNGRIITMADRAPPEPGSILIDGGRIVCVGDCDVSAAEHAIDLKGAWITPGLIDMHAHLHRGPAIGVLGPKSYRHALTLAYGFTTANDPSNGMRKWSVALTDMIDAGKMVGPRTISNTEAITTYAEGVNGQNLDPLVSLDVARDHVTRKRRLGGILMKEYRNCTRAQRQWIVEAAKEQGLGVTSENGNLNYTLSKVMDGQTGWEHMLINVPLYRDITEFFGRAKATYSATISISDYPHANGLDLFMSRQDILDIAKLRYWYPGLELLARRIFTNRPQTHYTIPLIARGAAHIKQAGGTVAVGGHGEIFGAGGLWDMQALATGMSPRQVLEAATIDGARFMGLGDDLGTIEAGKMADLAVFEANPLETIDNVERVRLVIKGGVVYDAFTLDQLWPETVPYGFKPWRTIGDMSGRDR